MALTADKNREATDRIISLRPMAGKSARSTQGLTDSRLFSGGNRLHAILEHNGLWHLKYDSGLLEQALQQRFTNFPALMKHVRQHFAKRNVEVAEVID